ncbi:hypothetical protein D9619_001017 [Psilocybe cf. subviscida]|uniref:Fork-head domain-containing protein n=1 Tax=Psilocybe cf. subviscida TaxID=2480587 RepID=A0A8H5BDM7_9AGAR|nr:hypothetical protein D9619_001017 [Psilocybe cf. subviscida]
MDPRTRTASPSTDSKDTRHATPSPAVPQDKISAYYSLVFPHYTFYIQTLSITIGRRCAPNAATSSTAEQTQVDVDLGALKSVSRLHAKIEYDQDEDRFVLVVIGRNGAWVDGVWSSAGTRAPLGERSQVQIASRTFHFVLPPPPPPEDTPSPSSQSSANRPRSPSVDITSISPPSSQPSHSPPPPAEVKLSPSPEPELPVLPLSPSPPPPIRVKAQPALRPQPELPNSNSIGKSSKANSKKRKKSDNDVPPLLERPKPEDMPPKPPFTYAQLIFRAVKEIGGKATLQEICTWIMNTHEYYRFADGAWMSSVRHNLSSGRAFLKMERCGGDRGKGFFWSVDEKFAQTLEDQESKVKQQVAAAAQGLPSGSNEVSSKSRRKEKGALLEPPLKRSVKGDMKGALPPPLTSSPLPFKTLSPTPIPPAPSATANTTYTAPANNANVNAATGVFAYSSLPHTAQPRVNIPSQGATSTAGYSGTSISGPNPYASLTQASWGLQKPIASTQASSSTTPTPAQSIAAAPSTSTPSQAPPSNSAVVPDVVIPIILGPIPPTHPDYAPNQPNNSAKEGYMILHERKLILDPDVFAELTKEMLTELEKMGAREALGVLTSHMIRALKERRAKGRGKDKGARRPRGGARGTGRKSTVPQSAPFTNAPLERRAPPPAFNPAASTSPDGSTSAVPSGEATGGLKPPASVTLANPEHVPVPVTPAPNAQGSSAAEVENDPGSPIIVVDDDSEDDEGPAAKKRKIDGGLAVAS